MRDLLDYYDLLDDYEEDKSVSIFRFLAKSVNIYTMDEDIVARSNFKDYVFRYPNWSELIEAHVVVSTVINCGRFVEAGLMQKYEKFFEYLFIDECEKITEGKTLIPIAGVVADQEGVEATIVLAGNSDCGPELENEFSTKIGHGRSLLQRLLSHPTYKNNHRLFMKLDEIYDDESVEENESTADYDDGQDSEEFYDEDIYDYDTD
jgi:hypothetical protein